MQGLGFKHRPPQRKDAEALNVLLTREIYVRVF